MWQYALWGLLGGGVNLGVVFLEASRRVKGWPWASPDGPGGGVYAVSVLINLGVSTGTTAAVATTGVIVNGMIAFGIGVASPAVVKKLARYAESLLPEPPDGGASRRGGRGDDDGA